MPQLKIPQHEAMLGLLLFSVSSGIWLGRRYISKAIASPLALEQKTAISAEQLQHFIEHGYVVIPSVLTSEEITDARRGLHDMLRDAGVDVNDLASTAPNIAKLSSTAGSGGVLDVFYGSWKLKVRSHKQESSLTKGHVILKLDAVGHAYLGYVAAERAPAHL